MSATIKARLVARSLSCLDMMALICDPLEHGGAVTGASLADDLKGRTAAQIQERLLAYGVESALDYCAHLQILVARELENRAATIGQLHDEHAGAAVDADDGADAHRASVGPRQGGAA